MIKCILFSVYIVLKIIFDEHVGHNIFRHKYLAIILNVFILKHKVVQSYPMTIPFTTRRRILWGDSDPAGILYTPRVFHYALETVEEWLIEMFGYTSMTLRDNLKIDTPTVKMSCEFMYPMKTSEYIDISLEIKKLGKASLNYVFDGFDSKKNHCFHVDQVVCFVDVDSFKAIPISIEFRKKIEAYQLSCNKFHEETGIN